MTDDPIFFFPDLESGEDGNVPLPPAEMRFVEVRPEQVLDDGPKRFRLYIEITPFQQRPYIDMAVMDLDGNEVSSANIIEPIMKKNVLTMHLRGGQKSGQFKLHARLFYPDVCESDRMEIDFSID